jgi:hypothetical protein
MKLKPRTYAWTVLAIYLLASVFVGRHGMAQYQPGGGGTTSPLTTQGDVWGYNGTANIRVPIGNSNGLVATVNNGFVAGWDWESPAGGANYQPPYINIPNTSNYYGPIYALTPPATTGWSWTNQGSSTVSTANSVLTFAFVGQSGTDHERTYLRSLPASTGYTAIMGISTLGQAIGVCLSDGTKVISYYQSIGASGPAVTALTWTTASSFNGTYFTNIAFSGMMSPLLWMRVKDASGSRTFSISSDGQNWTVLDSQASATFLTETSFGICQETNTTITTSAAVIADLRVSTP